MVVLILHIGKHNVTQGNSWDDKLR